jgi:fatty acid synthase
MENRKSFVYLLVTNTMTKKLLRVTQYKSNVLRKKLKVIKFVLEKLSYIFVFAGNEFLFIRAGRPLSANRVSYALGLKGSSMLLDAACSSSGYAIDCAYSAIRGGTCDAALICGSQLLLSPKSTMVFQCSEVLSKDGYGRPFDQDADGFVRGEAVAAVYLQKLKDAKRVYATLVHSITNSDGRKEKGIHNPSHHAQTELEMKFYQELNMNPNIVNFIEAHCTGNMCEYSAYITV